MQVQRPGHIGQCQGAQPGQPPVQRGNLALHHLACHPQQRHVAPLYTAVQPKRLGQGSAFCRHRHPAFGAAHGQRGQGRAIQLHLPPPRAFGDDQVRFPHIAAARIELRPRFRIKAADHAQAGQHIGLGHGAEPGQGTDFARSDHAKVIKNGLHDRIQPVGLLRLQAQAFGQRPGEEAGRLDLLQAHQHRFGICRCAAGLTGQVRQRPAQPARRFQRLGQNQGDLAFPGRAGQRLNLGQHMRHQTGGRHLGIRRAAVATPGSGEGGAPARQPCHRKDRRLFHHQKRVPGRLFLQKAGQPACIHPQKPDRLLQPRVQLQPLGLGQADPLPRHPVPPAAQP